MKSIATISAAALLAISGSATAFDGDGSPMAMGYLNVPLDGASRLERQPTYGVGMTRVDLQPYQATPNVLAAPRFMDVKFQQGALQSVSLNRATFVYRDAASGQLKAFGDMDDPLTWAAVGLAAVGAACLAEFGICD